MGASAHCPPARPPHCPQVLVGEISPALLVELPPEELASDAQREENARIREKNLFDSAPSSAKQARSGREGAALRCAGCALGWATDANYLQQCVCVCVCVVRHLRPG